MNMYYFLLSSYFIYSSLINYQFKIYLFFKIANKIIYSGSSDHTVRAWVIDGGNSTRVYKGHQHTVSSVRFFKGLRNILLCLLY